MPVGCLLDVALMPHPPIVVPEVGRHEIRKVEKTLAAMRQLARDLAAQKPEALIIISPHSPALRDAVPVLSLSRMRGSLADFGAPQVKFAVTVERELTAAIAGTARQAGVPVRLLDDPWLEEEMDHGIMVPLYFLRAAGLEVPLVAAGIGFLPRQQLYAFGAALQRAVKASCYRAVLVASGDLSHRLLPGAPAGYHPRGEVFDRRVQELLEAMDVEGILGLPEDLVEDAGECGFRPYIMALGALEGLGAQARILSYEGPFGVGYLVAELRPGRVTAGKESLPVSLARQSLEHYVKYGRIIAPPEPLPEELKIRAGAFVSLKKFGELRGCIGTVEPTRANVAEEIIYNAISAGLHDPRFLPVQEEELPYLNYSVDILEKPEPVKGMDELDPKTYGVIVRRGRRSGLLLPDLEGINTPEEQVAIACRKAGIDPSEPYTLERFRVRRYT
ncbi:MAG: hypothetical protein PWP65_1394 [Clostridia bacterium]|nr:hypothetical protein [Clostridia bacterium]